MGLISAEQAARKPAIETDWLNDKLSVICFVSVMGSDRERSIDVDLALIHSKRAIKVGDWKELCERHRAAALSVA